MGWDRFCFVHAEAPLHCLRQSFPASGEAAGGSSWDTPLPRLRGSCPEGTEGVLAYWRIAPCNEGLRNAHLDNARIRPSPPSPLPWGEGRVPAPSSPPKRSGERGPPRTLRYKVPDRLTPSGMTRRGTEGVFRPPPIPWRSGHPPSQIQFCASGKCRSMDRLSQRLGLRLFLVPKCRSGRISQGARRHLPSHSAALRLG